MTVDTLWKQCLLVKYGFFLSGWIVKEGKFGKEQKLFILRERFTSRLTCLEHLGVIIYFPTTFFHRKCIVFFLSLSFYLVFSFLGWYEVSARLWTLKEITLKWYNRDCFKHKMVLVIYLYTRLLVVMVQQWNVNHTKKYWKKWFINCTWNISNVDETELYIVYIKIADST